MGYLRQVPGACCLSNTSPSPTRPDNILTNFLKMLIACLLLYVNYRKAILKPVIVSKHHVGSKCFFHEETDYIQMMK